jgi:urease subunit alpha
MVAIARRDYAALYGPTVGDGVRLADTSLVAIVEKDHAVYGDECLHGGGKTLRDGIGLAAGVTSAQGALDLLLCNVLVIDPVIGIVKGDLGIKDGRVVGLGKAGNPAIMDGVDPRLLVSAATTVRDCEGPRRTASRSRWRTARMAISKKLRKSIAPSRRRRWPSRCAADRSATAMHCWPLTRA